MAASPRPPVSRAQREPAALAGGVSSLPGSHQAFPSSIFYSRSPARLFSAEEAPSGSGNASPSHGGTFSRRFAHSVTRRVRARPRCHRQPPGTRRRPHGSLAGVGDAGTHPRGPLSGAGGVSAPRGPLCGAARWVRAGARLLWGLFCRGMERGVGSSIPPVLPAPGLARSPGRAGGRTHQRVPRRELSLCLKFVGSAWIPPRERQRGCNEFLCHCTRHGGEIRLEGSTLFRSREKKKDKPQTTKLGGHYVRLKIKRNYDGKKKKKLKRQSSRARRGPPFPASLSEHFRPDFCIATAAPAPRRAPGPPAKNKGMRKRGGEAKAERKKK